MLYIVQVQTIMEVDGFQLTLSRIHTLSVKFPDSFRITSEPGVTMELYGSHFKLNVKIGESCNMFVKSGKSESTKTLGKPMIPR